MFITKKVMREKIEEAIAKEHEREAIKERIEQCDREFQQAIQWLRQDYNKLLEGMDARIRKLEGNQPKDEPCEKACY